MRPIDSSKWDFHSNDEKTQNLLEWGVAIAQRHVVMRVGYATSHKEWDIYQKTDRPPHQIQASMSATAAKELAAQLIVYAEWLELPQDIVLNGA